MCCCIFKEICNSEEICSFLKGTFRRQFGCNSNVFTIWKNSSLIYSISTYRNLWRMKRVKAKCLDVKIHFKMTVLSSTGANNKILKIRTYPQLPRGIMPDLFCIQSPCAKVCFLELLQSVSNTASYNFRNDQNILSRISFYMEHLSLVKIHDHRCHCQLFSRVHSSHTAYSID